VETRAAGTGDGVPHADALNASMLFDHGRRASIGSCAGLGVRHALGRGHPRAAKTSEETG
jgi:hypothetical protein